MECPICGYQFLGDWDRRERRIFELTDGAAIPAGATYERRRPAGSANLISDVAVPALQAGITGLVAGGVATGIAVAAGSPMAAVWGVAVGGGVTGFTWVALLRDHRSLLWEIERFTGADLDGDGQVGPPQTQLEIHIPGSEKRGPQTHFVDLPASAEQLRAFARGVMGGRSLAESGWTGAGRLFSKPEFARLRDALIERGLAVWVNPAAHAQGIALTAVGRWAFRRLAEG